MTSADDVNVGGNGGKFNDNCGDDGVISCDGGGVIMDGNAAATSPPAAPASADVDNTSPAGGDALRRMY